MSELTVNSNLSLANNVATASKNTLYGLRYHCDWKALVNKKAIIRSLEIDENFNYTVFTEAQRECLGNKLKASDPNCCGINQGLYSQITPTRQGRVVGDIKVPTGGNPATIGLTVDLSQEVVIDLGLTNLVAPVVITGTGKRIDTLYTYQQGDFNISFLGTVDAITELYLSNAYLYSFSNIKELQSLEKIDLSNNQLSQLEIDSILIELATLGSLTEVDLSGNIGDYNGLSAEALVAYNTLVANGVNFKGTILLKINSLNGHNARIILIGTIGKIIKINYNDGNVVSHVLTGGYDDITHTLTVVSDKIFNVIITGDITYLTDIQLYNDGYYLDATDSSIITLIAENTFYNTVLRKPNTLTTLALQGVFASEDVSANTILTSLSIKNTLIPSIDLSNNVNLNTLVFTYNTNTTTIDLTYNILLKGIYIYGNGYSQSVIDDVYNQIDAYGTNFGTIYTIGNASPSAGVIAGAIANLISRGWSVTY